MGGSGSAVRKQGGLFGSVIGEEEALAVEAGDGVIDPALVGSSFGSAGEDAEAFGSDAVVGVADGGEDLVGSGSAARKQGSLFGSVTGEEEALAVEAGDGVIDPALVGNSFGSAGEDV